MGLLLLFSNCYCCSSFSCFWGLCFQELRLLHQNEAVSMSQSCISSLLMKASIVLITGSPPRPGGRCLPGSRGHSLFSLTILMTMIISMAILMMMITFMINLIMMIIFMAILIMMIILHPVDDQEGGNPRQRLRALFNRRRAEGQTGDSNVS